MRVGSNPLKDKINEKSNYTHQVIIPVYIPNQEGYFKDSFKIFQFCLQSLFKTVHEKTFITIVNNGSCLEIKEYLNELFSTNRIHELIHSENIGKLNAILKGLAGNCIELVTISDADVLFLSGWQNESVKVFNHLPKVGVVGITPQFYTYRSNCNNIILENLFKSKLKFLPVKNPRALIQFYDSLGWKRDYNQAYLQYSLSYEITNDFYVIVGSGHFVATYRKDIFEQIISYVGYKMGGTSEKYLDDISLNKNYWRVTTSDNFAYHMGNTIEEWMNIEVNNQKESKNNIIVEEFSGRNEISSLEYFLINKLFRKIITQKNIKKLFYRMKGLPHDMINDY